MNKKLYEEPALDIKVAWNNVGNLANRSPEAVSATKLNLKPGKSTKRTPPELLAQQVCSAVEVVENFGFVL